MINMKKGESRELKLLNGLVARLCLLAEDTRETKGRYTYVVDIDVENETVNLFFFFCNLDGEAMVDVLKNQFLEQIFGFATWIGYGEKGAFVGSPTGVLIKKALIKKIPPSVYVLLEESNKGKHLEGKR